MYPVGYYLNAQGNEYEKSMLGFARGEKLTFKGKNQYRRSFAMAYSKSLAKSTQIEQLAWFIRNQDMLHLRIKDAHEPEVFRALLIGWKQHLSGSEVQVPIEIDATQSFAQITAALLRDKSVASVCNLVNVFGDDGEVIPQDLYGLVADRMSDILAKKAVA